MSSTDVQCTALNNAMRARGLSVAQVAQSIGSTEGHINDILSGRQRPTQQEFSRLAETLNITNPPPHDAAHTTS